MIRCKAQAFRLWLGMVVAALAACGGGGPDTAAPATPAAAVDRMQALSSRGGDEQRRDEGRDDEHSMSVRLSVLSSPAHQVSGGDARVHLRAARGLRDKLELWLNGRLISPPLAEVIDGFEGVVSGLSDGRNVLQVRHRSAGVRDTLSTSVVALFGAV